jgi:hypothetical protein
MEYQPIPSDSEPVFTTLPAPPVIANVGLVFTQLIAAMDADGDALSFSGSFPDWLTLVDHGDGTATLTGTPPADAPPIAVVSLSVSDGSSTPPAEMFILCVNQRAWIRQRASVDHAIRHAVRVDHPDHRCG